MTSSFVSTPRNHYWDIDPDTVLVACDDPTERSRLVHALREGGYAVIQESAAKHAARHLPQRGNERRSVTPVAAAVIVADADAVFAWQLAERVRNIDWALPIVVLASNVDAATRDEAAFLSIDVVLEQPVYAAEVTTAVDLLVRDGREAEAVRPAPLRV